MKNRLVSHLVLGFSVVALPFLTGCSQQSAGGSNPFVSSASAEPVSVENDLAAVTETVTNAPAPVDEIAGLANTNTPVALETNTLTQAEAVTAETAFSTEQKPPSNVRLSPVLSEAVKLVQAGVNQSIVLNYITNTTGYFALGAEEIVYLNDLGVSGDVITTMMEHDKELRELRMNAWQTAQAAVSNQPPQQAVQPEPEVAAAPTYVEEPQMEAEPAHVSNDYFYSTLSPYGSWVYVPNYGRCWRPTVAVSNPGWRPYCDRGRWVSSDCGWYWLSDYSWGSTAFHYGRWFNDNRWGWCWYPDNVWAPSWVSWRYTSDYCGWAPLPPRTYYQSGFGLTYNNGSVGVSFGFGLGASSYAFVPWGTFCNPRPYQYCVPASGAVQVYNNSTPYNQWEGGGSGRAYNRGLAPERVRELSRTEVRTVSVQDQTGRNPRAERLERDGRTLTVRRPQFAGTSTDVGNVSGTTSRPGGRSTVAPKTSEPVTSTSPQPQPVTPVTATTGRTGQREQWIVNRTSARTASPVVPVAEPKVESKPPVGIPTRGEDRPSLEGDTEVVNRTRSTRPVVTQPTQLPVTTPARAAKTVEPRVVQSVPQSPRPAPRSSIIVIGGGNNTRSGGRDYSVWNTPSQQPASSSSPENNNVPTRTTPPANVSTPQITDNSPAPAARGPNNGWQNRGNNNNRPENRGANQNYSTPQAGQVITPSAQPAPAANYNARPVQSAPSQNYAPRSQPAPAPNVSRVESRPAPAPAQSTARTTAPTTAPSGQTQGRPNR